MLYQKNMQRSLQKIDLDNSTVIVPAPVATSIIQLQIEIAQSLLNNNFAEGWKKANSLNPQKCTTSCRFFNLFFNYNHSSSTWKRLFLHQ